MEEGNGLAELAKPMYDKKMWDDDGALIQPLTFRAVADIVLDIVGNATGHKWIGYLDDALFATLDLTGGYKTPAEVGLELGKKALTSAVSYGASSIGSAASAAASAAITNTAANVAAQAGISISAKENNLWRTFIPAGTQIGNVGNTGKSSGPHLHWEFRQKYQFWKNRE